MWTRHAIFALLLLAPVLSAGCSSGDTGGPPRKTSLEQVSEDIVGGTWESGDESGDALNFRPNGTGQSYLAATDVTAEINWSIDVDNGEAVLTWGYIETRPEDEKIWVVDIDGDTMRVWPLSGSQVLLDPENDDPFVLTRFE
jgi:hypothetical protein